MTATARIKKIELSITLNDKTDPERLADIVEGFFNELKNRGIIVNETKTTNLDDEQQDVQPEW